jgi:ribosomal protein L15E
VLGTLDVSVSETVRAHCQDLPVVNTVSSPDPEKWRKRKDEIRAVAPLYRDIARELGYEAVL